MIKRVRAPKYFPRPFSLFLFADVSNYALNFIEKNVIFFVKRNVIK